MWFFDVQISFTSQANQLLLKVWMKNIEQENSSKRSFWLIDNNFEETSARPIPFLAIRRSTCPVKMNFPPQLSIETLSRHATMQMDSRLFPIIFFLQVQFTPSLLIFLFSREATIKFFAL